MSRVEILKGVSLSELAESVPLQMGAAWQQGHPRTQIIVLLQRHHRSRFEGLAATIPLVHPCWSLFYRPRAEAAEIAESGLDPKSASFMFLDVAMADLGKWVGPLVKDDWVKEEVIITPSEDVAEFTTTKWTCFRDPWLAKIDVLPLAKSPMEAEAKAWLTFPTSASTAIPTPTTQVPTTQVGAAGGASQPTSLGDSEFGGMLADLTHSFGAGIAASTTPPTPTTAAADQPPVLADSPSAQPEPEAFVMPSGPVSIPNLSGGTSPAKQEEVGSTKTATSNPLSPQPVEIPIRQSSPSPETEIAEGVEVVQPTPSPNPEASSEEEGEDVESELIDTINLLKAGGLEAEQILESPAFQEVSERATAAGLDAWTIFIANAS